MGVTSSNLVSRTMNNINQYRSSGKIRLSPGKTDRIISSNIVSFRVDTVGVTSSNLVSRTMKHQVQYRSSGKIRLSPGKTDRIISSNIVSFRVDTVGVTSSNLVSRTMKHQVGRHFFRPSFLPKIGLLRKNYKFPRRSPDKFPRRSPVHHLQRVLLVLHIDVGVNVHRG